MGGGDHDSRVRGRERSGGNKTHCGMAGLEDAPSDAAVGHQHQQQRRRRWQQHLRAARCISAAGGGSKCAREGEADDVKSFKLFRSPLRDT